MSCIIINLLKCHNPCFYGINFAIVVGVIMNNKEFATILVFMELTLQFENDASVYKELICHNPCFYGINFAMSFELVVVPAQKRPQSLFLWN